MTYSPLSTPRSRAVVALLDKSRFSKHRSGQRKVSEIVEENNDLIKSILGLKVAEGGDIEASPEKGGPGGDYLERAELKAGEVKQLEKKLQEQVAENLGLQRKLRRITKDAKYFRTQHERLLSYLKEDELRSLQTHLFESEIERLGAQVAKLNESNMRLSEKLEGHEKSIEYSIEPRGLKHSREKWVENITKAAELDYVRALGSHPPSTSARKGGGGRGGGGVTENGCHFMLSPTAAAVKLASLREKLDELGRKVLIVEKARDSGYQENDYISIKIKKVNGQTDLADEKLAQIKQFKKKIEEISKVHHQDNILVPKRESYAHYLKDEAKYYVPPFASAIDEAVEGTTTAMLNLSDSFPSEAASANMNSDDEENDRTEEGSSTQKAKEEEESNLAENETGSDSLVGGGDGESAKPKPETGDPTPRQSPKLDPVLEEEGPTQKDKEEEEEAEEEDFSSKTPEKLHANAFAQNQDDLKKTFSSATSPPEPPAEGSQEEEEGDDDDGEVNRFLEISTQTPPASPTSVNPILDLADQLAREEESLSQPSRLTAEMERVNQRLFAIKKRKALAYRDLTTKTLRSLAEEALEEKELLKRLKKLQGLRNYFVRRKG